MKTKTPISMAIALGLVQGAWAAPVSPERAVDGDFSDGETATATFDKDCNVFFDAKIEEK